MKDGSIHMRFSDKITAFILASALLCGCSAKEKTPSEETKIAGLEGNTYTSVNSKKEEYGMDDILGLEELGLNYETSLEGLDGECFNYGVYFDGCSAESKLDEVSAAVTKAEESFDAPDPYIGYIDVTVEGEKINIFHDLGNVDPESCDAAIHAVLLSLNDVSGIKHVAINEDF